MNKKSIFQELQSSDDKLAVLGVTPQELRDVALSSAAERNNATQHHPANAPGTFSYMEGTKALRDLLTRKGWVIDRSHGVEGVISEEKNVVIVFQNVDLACGASDPKPISAKGEGSKALVENNAAFLFDYMEQDYKKKLNTLVWFFCVSFQGDEIRAELSLPKHIERGKFGAFLERIFIISNDEWLVDKVLEDQEEEELSDFDIPLTRKE